MTSPGSKNRACIYSLYMNVGRSWRFSPRKEYGNISLISKEPKGNQYLRLIIVSTKQGKAD